MIVRLDFGTVPTVWYFIFSFYSYNAYFLISQVPSETYISLLNIYIVASINGACVGQLYNDTYWSGSYI